MLVRTLARLLSIVGHPAFLSPLAVLAVTIQGGSSLAVPATVTLVSVTSVVMLYAFWKVRTGQWRHVDASVPEERRSLNVVLAFILGMAALIVAQHPGAEKLSAGCILGGIIPVIAMLCSRWVKLSQHVAFASFTAAWLWAVAPWLSCAGFFITLLVAWSRIELRRHTRLDVGAGFIAGASVGGLFLLFLRMSAA